MRVAVVCDFMEVIGGGERVALCLAEHFDAPLFTTRLDPSLPEKAGFPGVRVTSIGRAPATSPLRQIGATLRFSQAKFADFDRILCVGNFSLYAAAGHPRALWYCLTPTRMLFDYRRSMLRRAPVGTRALAAIWSAAHARWEQRAVRRTRRIVTLSETVRERIRRTYDRDVPVVYPPVRTSQYRFAEIGDFWLAVNRLHPDKRIDLQLETFRRLPDERLRIVGARDGSLAHAYANALKVPPNVRFLGEVDQRALVDLLAHCRGLIATAEDEDFGLTPVEAMAAGKSVLATDEGGYRETVVPGETGFLLPPDPRAFAEEIRQLDDASLRGMRPACETRARVFDETIFVSKMREEIERADEPR
ncbi:MAG: glycosyltransferase [Methanobacteriota archaeon]